jgi:hypothetical protein
MKPSKIIIAALVAIVFFLSACEDKGVTPRSSQLQPPTTDMSATLPLFLENQWAYVESLEVDGSNPTTRLSVETVAGYSTQGGRTWWAMEVHGYANLEYSIRCDSVYARRRENVAPDSALMYLLLPETADTVHFRRSTLYGSYYDSTVAFALNGPLTVPVGTFDSVLVFQTHMLPGHFLIEYFRPRIGLLRYEYFVGSALHQSSSLVYYQIAH